MVAALVLGTSGAIRGGSSPLSPTKLNPVSFGLPGLILLRHLRLQTILLKLRGTEETILEAGVFFLDLRWQLIKVGAPKGTIALLRLQAVVASDE